MPSRRNARRAAAALGLMSLVGADAAWHPHGLNPAALSKRNTAAGTGYIGAISSEQRMCSQVGVDLLKSGGNAADAVVGTVFCVGTMAMYHSGIGGGGFMLVRRPNGTYEYIDFRETAAASYSTNMYDNDTNASLYGGLAAGVPGEVRGMEYLHKNYGKLPWKKVIEPAINLARHGWRVNEDQVKYFHYSNYTFLTQDPTWSVDFAPNGTLLGLNQTMTRKRYANTLEKIANEGADAFYTGVIANQTIAALRAAGGTMTLEDLANYRVATRAPSNITYRGYKLTSTGAPAGGSVALSALKIMDGYKGFGKAALVNLTTHRINEAMKFAYGQRTQLGDPSYVDNALAYQHEMLSDAMANKVRSKISDDTTYPVSYYDPNNLEVLTDHGTSYITGFDNSGLAIALTTTINTYFGSQVMTEGGIVMNNEMNDFSIPGANNAFGYAPSEANYIKPGKRPLSSISPVIVEDASGRLYLATSCAGGSRIITETIQSLHHVLDRNLTSHEALSQPRLHEQLSPSYITFEYAYDNKTVAYLRDVMGNNVTWTAPGSSTAGMVRWMANDTFEAAGEPRQKNSAGLVARYGWGS